MSKFVLKEFRTRGIIVNENMFQTATLNHVCIDNFWLIYIILDTTARQFRIWNKTSNKFHHI